MPAAYIHERIAKKALAQISPLSTSIKDNLDAFELGSQGPDILFFYNIINFLNRNTRPNHLGERMHKERISALFKEILINTKNQKGIAIAWSLGFVSHYAVDCTIHPYVYAMSNNDDGTTNTTKHLVLESQFDTWCYQRRHAHGVPRQVRCISKLSENQISEIAHVIDESCNVVFPESELTLKQAKKTIGDMNKIVRILHSTRRLKHHIFSFLEKLVRHPQIITRHAPAQQLPEDDFLNLNHTTWYNPWDKTLEYTHSFPELFDIAVNLSHEYISALISYYQDEASLEETLEVLGNKNYHSSLENS